MDLERGHDGRYFFQSGGRGGWRRRAFVCRLRRQRERGARIASQIGTGRDRRGHAAPARASGGGHRSRTRATTGHTVSLCVRNPFPPTPAILHTCAAIVYSTSDPLTRLADLKRSRTENPQIALFWFARSPLLVTNMPCSHSDKIAGGSEPGTQSACYIWYRSYRTSSYLNSNYK